MNAWMRLALIAGVLASCSLPRTRHTLADLEAEQQRQAARLEQIRAEIEISEARAEEARRRAAYEQCRANAAAIRAGVALRRAECSQQVAEQHACFAANERGVTESAVGGCGLGLLVGILSGGSLAGFALAGCGVGLVAGEGSRNECPAPMCIREADEWLASESARQGHLAMPVCGVGIEIGETVETIPRALLITEIVRGTAAEHAGLRAGDVLLRVGGFPVRTRHELGDAIQAAVPDVPIAVQFVRDGVVHSASATITEASIAREGRPLLGVVFRPEENIRFSGFAVSVVPPASTLVEGDRLISIAGATLRGFQDVDRAFMETSERDITVTVERGGHVVEVVVSLDR